MPTMTATPSPSIARSDQQSRQPSSQRSNPPASIAPTPLPTDSALATLESAGTCSSGQLRLGTSDWGFGYGLGVSLFLSQVLRNTGVACKLALPNEIAVAPAVGPYTIVATRRGGQVKSVEIGSGDFAIVVLGATWDSPFESQRPCEQSVVDVTRVALPVQTGQLLIDLSRTWKYVCGSPVSTSVSFKVK